MNGLREKEECVDVLDILEDYIVENGKPEKIMHDNGKQFTSKIFKRFLKKNKIRETNQFQKVIHNYKEGKIEAYTTR